MLRYAVPLFAAPLALGALAAPIAPAAAAEIQIQSAGPVVELNVTESVKAKPDTVTVGTGVTSMAPTAVAAMQQNAKAMSAVIDRIKALGVSPDDIQTTGINLSAQYDYDQTAHTQVFRGYQASNRVSVTLRRIEDTGRILDSLVAAGATDIDGPNFSIADDSAAKAQARKAALSRAQAQALEYARIAGYSGVKLLEVSEAIYSQQPQPMMVKAMARDAAYAPTPVEPGMVSASVSIGVKYEMTR